MNIFRAVGCGAALFLTLLDTSPLRSEPSRLVTQAAMKVRHIEDNAKLRHPDQSPTEFGEQETNEYLASGDVMLPMGMRSVKFRAQPGVVTAFCVVDFDQLNSGKNSGNPLLAVFSGVHNVIVVARARGFSGQGIVDVQSVSLDDVGIPRFILQMFIESFLQSKYPAVGMTSRFSLPDKIETATIGERSLVVVQK